MFYWVIQKRCCSLEKQGYLFILGSSKKTSPLLKQGPYLCRLSSPFCGLPLPPPLRRRRLWMVSKVCRNAWSKYVYLPSSIYSCSIDHILEHEFCHLGCWAPLWAVSEKFLKRRNFCLSMLLFGVVFSCFHGQKNIFSNIFLHCSVRTKKLHKMK